MSSRIHLILLLQSPMGQISSIPLDVLQEIFKDCNLHGILRLRISVVSQKLVKQIPWRAIVKGASPPLFMEDLVTNYNFSKFDFSGIRITNTCADFLATNHRIQSMTINYHSHFDFWKYQMPSNLTELNI